MKKSKSLYHNELIGALTIASVCKHGDITNAKVLLILPLLFHRETLEYITKKKIYSIKALVANSNLVATFNQRYYSLLSVSLNSVLIGKELNLLESNNSYLSTTPEPIPYEKLGSRINKIKNVSVLINKILSAPTKELYFHLRIKL